MTVLNELICFLVWPLLGTAMGTLCTCLVGALPHKHYVIGPFLLCGVRVLHPAQMMQPDLRPTSDRSQAMATAKKEEKERYHMVV